MATPTSLPASFSTGAVLTATQMNNLRGAFRVLQVVEGTTTTAATSSSTSYADTNLTATITPSATSSLVLVIVQQGGCYKDSGNAGNGLNIKLLRGATTLQTHIALGYTGTALNNFISPVVIVDLDNPATTSATTYKTQFANRTAAATVAVQDSSQQSNIILMEISA